MHGEGGGSLNNWEKQGFGLRGKQEDASGPYGLRESGGASTKKKVGRRALGGQKTG